MLISRRIYSQVAVYSELYIYSDQVSETLTTFVCMRPGQQVSQLASHRILDTQRYVARFNALFPKKLDFVKGLGVHNI